MSAPPLGAAAPDRGRLPAILWAVSILAAALLGFESWARAGNLELSVSALVARTLGLDAVQQTVDPIEGLGRWYGWIGSCFFALSFLYVPRKRLETMFARLGSRRANLDFHYFFGGMGFLFAAYHINFRLGNPLWRLVFATAVLAVLTGLVAAYFHDRPGAERASKVSLVVHVLAALLMVAAIQWHAYIGVVYAGWIGPSWL